MYPLYSIWLHSPSPRGTFGNKLRTNSEETNDQGVTSIYTPCWNLSLSMHAWMHATCLLKNQGETLATITSDKSKTPDTFEINVHYNTRLSSAGL
jgi:hypothetical protein